MSTTTLVTGAAGFAGSHLLDLLRKDPSPVVAWHRPGGGAPRAAGSTKWEPVDLLDQIPKGGISQSTHPK